MARRKRPSIFAQMEYGIAQENKRRRKQGLPQITPFDFLLKMGKATATPLQIVEHKENDK